MNRLGGTPTEFLDNQELMEVLMPMLRAGFSVVDTYEYQSSMPLDCPITACAGAQDRFACGSTMAGGQSQTVGGFSIHELQGGHFFIHQQEQEARQIVLRDLPRWFACRQCIPCLAQGNGRIGCFVVSCVMHQL